MLAGQRCLHHVVEKDDVRWVNIASLSQQGDSLSIDVQETSRNVPIIRNTPFILLSCDKLAV